MIEFNQSYYSDYNFEKIKLLNPESILEKTSSKFLSIQEIDDDNSCLLTHTCTSALELTAQYLLEKFGKIQIIVPSFTFCTSASAFIRAGHDVIFTDCSLDSLCAESENYLNSSTKSTKCIVVVHYAGNSPNMDAIMKIANNKGWIVIEDAAQAVGSKYNGKSLGSFGDFGCFSFHHTKNISIGEGGALVYKNSIDQDLLLTIYEKGTSRYKYRSGKQGYYDWECIGSSYPMNHFLGGYLYQQLHFLHEITSYRQKVNDYYMNQINVLPNIKLPKIDRFVSGNGHISWFLVNNKSERQKLIYFMKENGVSLSSHYLPLHLSPAMKTLNNNVDLSNSVEASDCVIRLPTYFGIEVAKQDKIIFLLNKYFNN